MSKLCFKMTPEWPPSPENVRGLNEYIIQRNSAVCVATLTGAIDRCQKFEPEIMGGISRRLQPTIFRGGWVARISTASINVLKNKFQLQNKLIRLYINQLNVTRLSHGPQHVIKENNKAVI